MGIGAKCLMIKREFNPSKNSVSEQDETTSDINRVKVKAIEVEKDETFIKTKTNGDFINEYQEELTFITSIIDDERAESPDNEVKILKVDIEKLSAQYNAQTYKSSLNENTENNRVIMQKETKLPYQVKSNMNDHELQWSESLTTHEFTASLLETNNIIKELEAEFGKFSVQYNAETYKLNLKNTMESCRRKLRDHIKSKIICMIVSFDGQRHS